MPTGADTVKDTAPIDAKRCPECASRFGRDAQFCPFDGTALQASAWDPTGDPLTRTVVAGRYEVLAPLGEGGMGTVYKVRHLTLDREFAMKVLRRELAKDPALSARFMQEAKATAAIHHPSIVAINDFGVLDDGAPYFVMELLVGETLATYLHARGILPPRTAAGIARRLADALAAAHAVAVVHRDLKPENVFLVGAMSGKEQPDDVRIVDFGAAKVMGTSQLTRPGVVFGTPYYMSPEQASGSPIDGRADVYSLGVLLYEMVTGNVPFEADTYMGVLTKHMFQAPSKPSERAMGVQLGALEDIVMKALEKDPNDRYPSMEELSVVLARAAGPAVRGTYPMANAPPLPVVPSSSTSVRPLELEPRTSTADRIESSVARQVHADAQRQRRLIAIGTVCVIGALSAIGGAISFARSDAPVARALPAPPPPTTTTSAVVAPSATADLPPPEPAASAASEPTSSVSTSVSTQPSAPVFVPRPVASASRPKASSTPAAAVPPPNATTTATPPPATGKTPDDFKDPWQNK